MKTWKQIKALARIESDLLKQYRRGTTGMKNPMIAFHGAAALRMRIRMIRRRRRGVTHI